MSQDSRERDSLQRRISDWLDMPLAILSLVWAILVVAELALKLPAGVSERIYQVDFAIWLVFALVFLVEFLLAPSKPAYLRTNALSALSIVLPFIRAVRIVRLARLLRSTSLVRIVLVGNRATRAVGRLFSEHRFGYVLGIIAIATLLAAAGTYFFEQGAPNSPFTSFGEAIWWAATMVTTVNSGTEPVTVEGRVIAMLLRIVGLAVFGYLTASIASFLIGERGAGEERRREEIVATQEQSIRDLATEIRLLRGELEQLKGIDTSSGSSVQTRATRRTPPEDKAA